MKKSWELWLKKKGINKWFQRDNLIILVLSGILLFIIALPTKESTNLYKNNSDIINTDKKQEELLENSLADTEETIENITENQYVFTLEQRLKNTLTGMEGVGKVKVMITLKSSEELVVEKDIPTSRQSTTEQDAQGGSRSVLQTESKETTVYMQSGENSSPYVVKTLFPTIEGVVVVAQGAGDGSVNKNITEVVQALFNLEAHKIKVVKMETIN